MKDMMEYKNYYGSVHFDEEDNIFYGKVEFIKALASYEAATARKFRKSFENAVDDYLELCRERNVEPEKPFKGSFNVRLLPELHRRAVLAAKRKGFTLNRFVAEALEKATN